MHTITLTRRTIAFTVVALVLGTALVAGTTAWAATRTFSDVPASHPFFHEIEWAVDHGIVTGYGDGTFRPSGTVTRQAAVAFLSRYNASLTYYSSSTDPASGTNFAHMTVCPTGQRALAGGGYSDNFDLQMVASMPPVHDRWTVGWHSEDGALVDPGHLEVWVLCAPMPLAP